MLPAHATVVSVPDGASARTTMAVPSPMSRDPEAVVPSDTGSWAIDVPGPSPVPPMTVDDSPAARVTGADAAGTAGAPSTAAAMTATTSITGRVRR